MTAKPTAASDLRAMSLEELGMRHSELKLRWAFTGRQDGESECSAILAELRRRDEAVGRLVEAAKGAMHVLYHVYGAEDGPAGQQLCDALAAFQE